MSHDSLLLNGVDHVIFFYFFPGSMILGRIVDSEPSANSKFVGTYLIDTSKTSDYLTLTMTRRFTTNTFPMTRRLIIAHLKRRWNGTVLYFLKLTIYN